MMGYVWVVAYSYGMHRYNNERLLFDQNDATVVCGMLEEQCGEALQLDREFDWGSVVERSEFKCIGAAKARLGHVTGPFTTWSEEELTLRRYNKKPNDFCTLDVIGFYPCPSAWTIATRQGLKPGRGDQREDIKPLTLRNCQPLLVSGTDISDVEVRVDGKAMPISSLVGHNETIPCNVLCKPLCDLLGAGLWKTLTCSKAALLVHTWPVLRGTFDYWYFHDNEPAAPLDIENVSLEFIDKLLGSLRLWSQQVIKPDTPYHTGNLCPDHTRSPLSTFCKTLDRLSESLSRPASETMKGKSYKPGVLMDTIFFAQHLRSNASVHEATHDLLKVGTPTQLVKTCQKRVHLTNALPKKSCIYESVLTLDIAALRVSQQEKSRPLAAGQRVIYFFYLDSSPQVKVDWLIGRCDEIACAALVRCFKLVQLLCRSKVELQNALSHLKDEQDEGLVILAFSQESEIFAVPEECSHCRAQRSHQVPEFDSDGVGLQGQLVGSQGPILSPLASCRVRHRELEPNKGRGVFIDLRPGDREWHHGSVGKELEELASRVAEARGVRGCRWPS